LAVTLGILVALAAYVALSRPGLLLLLAIIIAAQC
jgi:hypothetical protein